jgi:endonuclease G
MNKILTGVFCLIAIASLTYPNFVVEAKAETAMFVSPNIVISQVFGGGGVAPASPFRNDFVEIFNRGGVPINLNGWSIQFSFAGNTTWLTTPLPNVTLQPGQYFLVQQAQSADGSGAPLPTPDAIGTINLHPINGKLAVVNTTTVLSGACPITNPTIVDFVGYGTGGCFEGSTPIGGMGITVSANRNGAGCIDTDQNANDFTVATPVPRNTSSPTTSCGPITIPLSGNGSAAPNVVTLNSPVLLSVAVTPADTPPSTGITVAGNLTNIGGPASQTFFDDGTNGDVTPGDNIFSFSYTIPGNLSGGARSLAVAIADAQARTANAIIFLSINAPFGGDDHILFGNPSNATTSTANENNYLMFKPQYILSYNRSRATANWVAWRLDSTWIGSAPRQDDFRPDSDLPTGWYQVLDGDYSGSGYDRGHMTPSGDRTRSIPDNSATFLMTNIIPQLGANNQGPWEEFETYCRTLAGQGNEIYIYSGVHGNIGTIAQGRVVVPAVTWKVVLVIPNGDNDLSRVNKSTRVFGIIVPNFPPVNINAPWRDFRVTVNAVENLTGYDFFTAIPRTSQEMIERRHDRQ